MPLISRKFGSYAKGELSSNISKLHKHLRCRTIEQVPHAVTLWYRKDLEMLSAGGRVISSVPQRLRILNQRLASRPVSTSCHVHAKQKQVGEGEPIPFSTSKAASWSMTNTVVMPERDVPWYQSLSIGLSMTVFMLYFFFLREENDLDIELNYSLFERVPHLEEHQLKVAVDYYRSQGRDTRELEKRLKEIQQNKQLQKEQES